MFNYTVSRFLRPWHTRQVILLASLFSTMALSPVTSHAAWFIPPCSQLEIESLSPDRESKNTVQMTRLCRREDGVTVKRAMTRSTEDDNGWMTTDEPLNTKDRIARFLRSPQAVALVSGAIVIASVNYLIFHEVNILKLLERLNGERKISEIIGGFDEPPTTPTILDEIEAAKAEVARKRSKFRSDYERPMVERAPPKTPPLTSERLGLNYEAGEIEVSKQKISESLLPKGLPIHIGDNGLSYVVQRKIASYYNGTAVPDAEYVAFQVIRRKRRDDGVSVLPTLDADGHSVTWSKNLYRALAHPDDVAKLK